MANFFTVSRFDLRTCKFEHVEFNICKYTYSALFSKKLGSASENQECIKDQDKLVDDRQTSRSIKVEIGALGRYFDCSFV